MSSNSLPEGGKVTSLGAHVPKVMDEAHAGMSIAPAPLASGWHKKLWLQELMGLVQCGCQHELHESTWVHELPIMKPFPLWP